MTQRRQRVLDQPLAFRVEMRGNLVEHEDPGVRQERARDRHPLTLSGGESHAALADSRRVSVRQAGDELIALGQPSRGLHLCQGSPRPAIADVGGDRAVEEEIVLQYDPQPRAVAPPMQYS